MRFHLAAVTAFLLAAAQARIDGMAAPKMIKPGEDFDIFILTEDYIQSVEDVGFAAGWWPNQHISPGSLGFFLESMYLGHALSNVVHNISMTIQIPETAQPGPALITTSVMSLYGALYTPTFTNFNVSVIIGNETSQTYAYGGLWGSPYCS